MKKIPALLFCLLMLLKISAQNNSAHTRISILTCAPGDELYSLFGHTAIRIIDSTTNNDIVYNWGGFTFDQPYFMIKFLRGKLIYFSSADRFPDFMDEYITDGRSVYEQVLNLDSSAKKRVIDAVNFNSSGSNRFYKYDFLLDNCTTRLRDIIYKSNSDEKISTPVVPAETTARDLINFYLERGNHFWIELGMDILLGSRMDKPVSGKEAMYLPDFFMKGLNNTSSSSAKHFVSSFKAIYQGNLQPSPTWKYLPFAILTVTCVLLYILSIQKSKRAKAVTGFADVLLLYITGLVGMLVLFMWFASDHTACKNNYNILWALPTNFIIAFFMLGKPAWLSNYFFAAAVLTALLLGVWFWLPQQMNIALLPVLLLLLNRYISLYNRFKTQRIRT